jgi:hypothetical protein
MRAFANTRACLFLQPPLFSPLCNSEVNVRTVLEHCFCISTERAIEAAKLILSLPSL